MDNRATQYLISYVRPALEEWLDDQQNERRAMTLAGCLNNLPEYHLQVLKDAGDRPSSLSASTYRAQIDMTNRQVGLVRDVADAHKHLKLERKSRSLTNAEQTGLKHIGYGEGYGMAYGGGEVLVVILDDDSLLCFGDIVKSCYSYWHQVLGMESLARGWVDQF